VTLLAAFALLTTGVELIKGRCWSLSIYGLDWLWTVVWELWESGPDVGAFEPKLPVVTSQASICFFLASGDVFTCAHVCVCVQNGKEPWKTRLPTEGQAMPMTYVREDAGNAS
jgi:glucose dehydrogenase